MGQRISGTYSHPSALREGIITVLFFSLLFSSQGWGVGGGDIKCLILYFLTSAEAQAPLKMTGSV